MHEVEAVPLPALAWLAWRGGRVSPCCSQVMFISASCVMSSQARVFTPSSCWFHTRSCHAQASERSQLPLMLLGWVWEAGGATWIFTHRRL